MFLSGLFGSSIYRLRKKYDRAREKADRCKDLKKRTAVLRVLDQIEPTLVVLEERNVTLVEKNRMKSYVRSGINEAKLILKKDFVLPEKR